MDWVNAHYQDPEWKKALRSECASAHPFPHLVLPEFFVEKKIRGVAEVLKKQKFERRYSDLFSFEQTELTKHTILREFIAFYSSDVFRAYVASITGVRGLKSIDATGFRYSDTDHLLPHDDRMPGRKVAYVLNLSEGFTARDGGQLELFDGKEIGASYVPRFNSLVLFPVSTSSLHQVREVRKKERYTITGWFHG